MVSSGSGVVNLPPRKVRTVLWPDHCDKQDSCLVLGVQAQASFFYSVTQRGLVVTDSTDAIFAQHNRGCSNELLRSAVLGLFCG